MKIIRLNRYAYTPVGTFGMLWIDNQFWYTLEEPWRGNTPNESCIPAGTYDLLHCMHNVSTPGRYDDYHAYEIAGVQERNGIHIHIGNTIDDVSGCIVIGNGFGVIPGKSKRRLPAVLSSRVAFEQFMAIMGGEPARIEIVSSCPEVFVIDWRGVDL